MKVLIQVLNYNGKALTGNLFIECIESLYRQSYRELEISVIDNRSTDGSPDMIRNLFPETKIIEMCMNRATIAFNKGFREFMASDADLLLICNNDMIFDDDFIRNAVDYIRSKPDGGIFTPHITLLNKRINSTGIIMNRSGYAWDRDFNEESAERSQGEVFAASGGAMLIRRDIISKGIEFDPIYTAYYEDVDLSMRVRMSTHYKIYYIPDARAIHAFSTSWSRKGSSKDYFMMRNRFIFVIKYFPMRMLFNALRYLFFTSGTGDSTLDRRVYLDLIKKMPAIIRRRIFILFHYRGFPADMLEQYQGLPRITNL